MATTIRDLLVKLGVDAEGADKDIDKMESALGDLKDIMLGVVAVGAAVTAAIAGVALSAATAGDAVAKSAEQTGTGVEAYQRLLFAAEQNAVESEQLTQALAKQAKALTDLEAETGPVVEGYAALGLEAADLEGLSTDEAFIATAEALSQVTDEQERLQIAQQLYGEDLAGKLLPLINQGADGINELGDLAEDLGIVMSEEATASATEFGDTLDQMLGFLEGIKNQIGLALLPTLTDMLSRFRDWATANRELIATKLEQWVEVIIDGLELLQDIAMSVDAVVQDVFGGWEPIFAAAAAAAGFVAAAIAGLAALKAWTAITTAIAFVGTTTGIAFGQLIAGAVAVVGAIVLIGLAVEDLVVFFRGGDSAIGRFLDRFRESEGFLGALARRFEGLIAIGTRLVEIVKVIGAAWWEVFSRTTLPLLQLVWAAFVFLAEQGLGALALFWDNVLGPIADAMILAFDFILAKLEVLQPAFEGFLSILDTGLEAISNFTGVELGVGGGEETAAAAAPAGAGALAAAGLDTAAFAPTAAPAGTEGGGTTTTTANVAGNNYSFDGIGMSMEEVQALIADAEAERARQTAAALEGGEV